MTAAHVIRRDSAITPGTVAGVGLLGTVIVLRDATERHDWAAMARAITTAFARGASVHMEGSDHG